MKKILIISIITFWISLIHSQSTIVLKDSSRYTGTIVSTSKKYISVILTGRKEPTDIGRDEISSITNNNSTNLTGVKQAKFKWEKIDSVTKAKTQIYSDTKMFIAETWRAASSTINKGAIASILFTGKGEIVKNLSAEKHSIQNDDKDNGVILVKGEMEFSSDFMMNSHIYRYSYDIMFLMKDSKYKMTIDNVHCNYARCANIDWPLIEPCEDIDCPGFGETSMPSNKLIELMASLKENLENIADSYVAYIKKPSMSNGDW